LFVKRAFEEFFKGVILRTLGIREDLKGWGVPTVSHPDIGSPKMVLFQPVCPVH
jgi:hypothetical protein